MDQFCRIGKVAYGYVLEKRTSPPRERERKKAEGWLADW